MVPCPAVLGFSVSDCCSHTLMQLGDPDTAVCATRWSTAKGTLVFLITGLAAQNVLHGCGCLCRFYYRVGDGTTWSTTYSFTTFVDVSQGEPLSLQAGNLRPQTAGTHLLQDTTEEFSRPVDQ